MTTIFEDLQAELTRAETQSDGLEALRKTLAAAEDACDDATSDRRAGPVPALDLADATATSVVRASSAIYTARKKIEADLAVTRADARWAESALYEGKTGAMRAVLAAVVAGDAARLPWMLDELDDTIERIVGEMWGHRGAGCVLPSNAQIDAATGATGLARHARPATDRRRWTSKRDRCEHVAQWEAAVAAFARGDLADARTCLIEAEREVDLAGLDDGYELDGIADVDRAISNAAKCDSCGAAVPNLPGVLARCLGCCDVKSGLPCRSEAE